ncbi:uncharacterized protein MP3633_0046 [Marinomonas primoryensis]|uniref:Uncharacterized protein n=1 Tax=Marinomonas primoryensis TaxID=178399 RepID=A0A859CRP5_9GAMM|nr:uncharacterized protein MP3633_0046 [Marinomonas primoryensis]
MKKACLSNKINRPKNVLEERDEARHDCASSLRFDRAVTHLP